jgi:hypothetical protein
MMARCSAILSNEDWWSPEDIAHFLTQSQIEQMQDHYIVDSLPTPTQPR